MYIAQWAMQQQSRSSPFAMADHVTCKDYPYGQAGKLGFHKNMKTIWKNIENRLKSTKIHENQYIPIIPIILPIIRTAAG